MFETAEIGNRIGRQQYKSEVPRVRTALLEAQTALAAAPLSAVIVIGGVEGAGKSALVNRLLQWMDARGIQVNAMSALTEEERERPPMWRFWRLLPAKGTIAVFLGSWYTAAVIDHVFGRIDDGEFEQALGRIVDFEKMLRDEGTLLLKFWLHLSKTAQQERLETLTADPKQSWRVQKQDWKFFRKYDRFRQTSERALRRTSTGCAPWHIVEASDARYRTLTVTTTICAELNAALEAIRHHVPVEQQPDRPKPQAINIINRLDLSKRLDEKSYRRKLAKHTAKINLLTRQLYEQKRSMILVFEGPDAAGKGGVIRRLTSAMDARNYQVISVGAPTDEEKARPYLWRFWRQLPRPGRVTIFDRSWYGRVLVERIEGFCAAEEWQRAFAEINAFEQQLTDFGILVVKYWLAISEDEQLQRFEHRQTTPFKQYKLTMEDWRNREKSDAYEAAACDMIDQTSASSAPWVMVEANDKLYARIRVLKSVADTLKAAIG